MSRVLKYIFLFYDVIKYVQVLINNKISKWSSFVCELEFDRNILRMTCLVCDLTHAHQRSAEVSKQTWSSCKMTTRRKTRQSTLKGNKTGTRVHLRFFFSIIMRQKKNNLLYVCIVRPGVLYLVWLPKKIICFHYAKYHM